jgi:hypothetical protein
MSTDKSFQCSFLTQLKLIINKFIFKRLKEILGIHPVLKSLTFVRLK